MLRRFNLLLSAAAAVAVLLTSCTGDDDNFQTFTRNYTEAYYLVTDNQEGTEFVGDKAGLSVAFTYNYSNINNSTAVVLLKNLPSGGNGTTEDVQLNNLPLRVASDGWLEVTADGVRAAASMTTITNFKMRWLDRNIDGNYVPVVVLSFTVNDRYNVTLISKYFYCFGETKVTPPGATKVDYTDDDILYMVTLDPVNGKATLNLQGAKFTDAMPMRVDMEFADINLVVRHSGYSLSSDGLIPTSGGTPFPAMAVESLTGAGTFAGNLTLRFTVKDRGVVFAQLYPTTALALKAAE